MLLLILTSISLFASAQTCTWIDGEETGYNLNPSSVNYVVCVAPDQTVWFGGLKEMHTNYYLMMGKNILIRYDAQGDRLGTYLIDGTLDITSMKCDPDGNLYIAGDFMDQDIHFWDGSVLHWDGISINSFIARVNTAATVDWSVDLNTARGEYSPVADMAWRNGRMYLANSIWLGCAVSVIDGSGNLSGFVTESDVGILSGIDFDADGNLYCTGSCTMNDALFNGVSFPPPGFYNKYLVKYAPSGVPLWVRYSEDVTCIQPKIKVDADKNIYWTGALNGPCSFDTVTLQGPAWVYDFYLVKMTPDGSALWGREVPQVLTGDAVIGPGEILSVMPDNSVTIGGISRGMIDWGNGVVSNTGSVYEEAWFLNYSPAGEPLWTKTGAGSYTDVKSVDADLSGDLYFTGVGHDTVWFDNQNIYRTTYYYPYVVKLASTATGTAEKNSAPAISVVPDPARDFITLTPGKTVRGNVGILDICGRVVLRPGNDPRIDVSSLSSGIYFVKFSQKDGGEGTVRFVKL